MTPQQAANDVRNLAGVIAQSFNDAKTIVLQDFEGKQKQRIFNNAKATDGTDIETRPASAKRGPAYTKQYEKKRRAIGRQISQKDLMFEGNLEKSMVIGTLGNEPVYGFIVDKFRIIGEGLTRFAGKEIFTPSDDEVLEGNRVVLEYVDEQLRANGF